MYISSHIFRMFGISLNGPFRNLLSSSQNSKTPDFKDTPDGANGD